MQTIATTVASKALVAVVAAAMIFSAFVAPAKAATAEELQKMINDLMAQMAALGGTPATTGGSSASVCPFTWTRDLRTGATGADVKALQQFLNANADTRVAATGAGSTGMETEYFGPATAAAVSKFQVMYRADILTPAGLTNPTGTFGPASRAKANALCVAGATDEDDEDDEDSESGDLSGEADLTTAEINSADEDQIEEGAEEAPVAEFTVEFEDGDASISRMDVSISTTTNGVDAWDVLESVQLWVDGDMVAEEDASDEDNYLDENAGTIRFSGLDIVAMEDEELDIVIAVTVQNNVDSTDLGKYTVGVNAIRYFDADGVATTDDATEDLDETSPVTVDFTIEEAGFEDELVVKASANDPDATTLQLEDDSKSDFMHVFSFDIDSDDSVNDIEINEIVVNASTTLATYAALVDDAELEIDGVTIDDVTVTNGTSQTAAAVLTFDVDGDVTIEAGDRVEAKLMLRFKALATEGATIKANIASAAIDGEGADDVTSTGSATGDTHTLRSEGVAVELDSDSAVVTTGDLANDDYATYKIVLDVTAFEQDVFIDTDESVSVAYGVVNSGGTAVTASSTSVIIDSSAEVEGGSFKIAEGETESVTITVTFNPAAIGASARLQLTSLTFGATDGANNQTWAALPAEDYRTDIVTIVN